MAHFSGRLTTTCEVVLPDGLWRNAGRAEAESPRRIDPCAVRGAFEAAGGGARPPRSGLTAASAVRAGRAIATGRERGGSARPNRGAGAHAPRPTVETVTGPKDWTSTFVPRYQRRLEDLPSLVVRDLEEQTACRVSGSLSRTFTKAMVPTPLLLPRETPPPSHPRA